VKAQIAREFEGIVSKKVQVYPSLSTLKQLADEGKLLTEETFLVKELLESANDKALAIIDASMPAFVDQIMQMTSKQGDVQECTWQKLLMAFIWKVKMLPDLVRALEANQDQLDEQERAALRDYLELHHWKFDGQAL
jgi:predicted Mrr-cat superfamily restriction endonuclease